MNICSWWWMNIFLLLLHIRILLSHLDVELNFQVTFILISLQRFYFLFSCCNICGKIRYLFENCNQFPAIEQSKLECYFSHWSREVFHLFIFIHCNVTPWKSIAKVQFYIDNGLRLLLQFIHLNQGSLCWWQVRENMDKSWYNWNSFSWCIQWDLLLISWIVFYPTMNKSIKWRMVNWKSIFTIG